MSLVALYRDNSMPLLETIVAMVLAPAEPLLSLNACLTKALVFTFSGQIYPLRVAQ